MTDQSHTRGSLARALEEDQAERDASRPATAEYTGQPCTNCGRIRVYLRRDGRYICEKCETFQEPVLQPKEAGEPMERYFGKNCPVGMVQVEFVGCNPSERYSDYGWKPAESAFLELWVDGHRYRVELGSFPDSHGNVRRGLHIVGDLHMAVDHHSMNAVDVFLQERPV